MKFRKRATSGAPGLLTQLSLFTQSVLLKQHLIKSGYFSSRRMSQTIFLTWLEEKKCMNGTQTFVRIQLKMLKGPKMGLAAVFPDSIPGDGRKDSGNVRL